MARAVLNSAYIPHSVHSPQHAFPTACIPHSMHSPQHAFPTACIPYSACTHFPPCILLPSLHTLTSQPPQPLRPFRRPPQALAVCGHRYVVTARGTQRERKRRRPDKRGAVRSRSGKTNGPRARICKRGAVRSRSGKTNGPRARICHGICDLNFRTGSTRGHRPVPLGSLVPRL